MLVTNLGQCLQLATETGFWLRFSVRHFVRIIVLTVQGKTPIGHLQELCNKWGIIPLYQQVASEGPIHEPVFEFSVKVREYSATGRG